MWWQSFSHYSSLKCHIISQNVLYYANLLKKRLSLLQLKMVVLFNIFFVETMLLGFFDEHHVFEIQ